MITPKAFFFSLLIILSIACKNEHKPQEKKLSSKKEKQLTNYLNSELENTLGLAVAVIKDGELIYENYLGKENLSGKPVIKNTIFPLYSISKLITSTAIFQLIEENKLQLDDKISLYLDHLPKSWQTIKIKHLLSHSSGLPDYDVLSGKVSDSITFKKLTEKELRFEKGERWEYNQTNFWFLSKIIEKVTHKSYEEFVKENQFQHNQLLFSSNFIDPVKNRSFKYNFNPDTKQWEKVSLDFGDRTNAAGGINLTLNQFVEWTKDFDNNQLISPTTKEKMWTPFNYQQAFYFNNKKDEFLYGWEQYSSNNEISYGFTGGLVTGYRKFIHQDMTIIVFTNGLKEKPIHNKIISKIAGIVDSELN